ncbi:hypothetical protein [Mycobacterium sp. Root135]|uniref:hypothetical protein n=1 Tax=Mycobacterium sp. Root135 TaxID=1736457 RepID=UPI000AE5E29F|nr:hypothetical protein [Mycobacterium sp. Root135]
MRARPRPPTSCTAGTLRDAESVHDGPAIVPMTLVRDDYFDEIVGQLPAGGVDVWHYA